MPMYQKSMIMLLIIVSAVLFGTTLGYVTGDDTKPIDAATISTTKEAETESIKEHKIFVYVTGAVNKPGMVELVGDENSIRAADAINACGGLLPTADVDNFNMAQTIVDGQHIRVPEKIVEQVEKSDSSSTGQNKSSGNKKSSDSGGIVDINTANADELDTLPGIGPAMAQRIIDYRDTHGAFKSIEEIQNVRGIGPKKFENLKDRIKI